jgi:hypothetical protein
MSSRIPATTALLLATGVAIPWATADDLDDEVPPGLRSPADAAPPGLVGFEDSSRSPEPLFPALPSDSSPAPSISSTRAPHPAGPRFELTAGPYTSTRALRFAVSDSLADDELPMVSPQSTLVGFGVAASVFPVARDPRGRLVGPGIAVSYAHSVGAGADFLDEDDNDESMLTLPVVQAAYAIGLRYRQPLGPVLVEVGASHRTELQRIDERPDWVEIPDVEYRSIAAEARLEVSSIGGATIGFGGRYHFVLDTGEIASLDGYGSGTASAYELVADLDVPLTGGVFATAGLDYRKVTMTFAGDGDLATLEGNPVSDVFGATDRYVDARIAIGARY